MIDLTREGLVTAQEIKEVFPHPNADRLDIVVINGWECVVQRGLYKVDDVVLYFEIDSILPEDVESKIFPPDSKIKLDKHRVKTIKIRGSYSQGLVVPLNLFINVSYVKVGTDYTKFLKIGKYVPDVKENKVLSGGINKRSIDIDNPNFRKVRKPTHLNSIKLTEEDLDKYIVVTEKIHGTSCVAGWVKRPTNGILNKINNKLFGDYQFCYRSMNHQLQERGDLFSNLKRVLFKNTVDNKEKTLYGRMCKKYKLEYKLPKDVELCFEIYGSGIQKGYTYGCEEGEQKIAVYAMKFMGEYSSAEDCDSFCNLHCIPTVPILFRGVLKSFDSSCYLSGKSVLDPSTKVREGFVVNVDSYNMEERIGGVKVLKSINPDYLMKDNTEYN